jgi:hypothetical protein
MLSEFCASSDGRGRQAEQWRGAGGASCRCQYRPRDRIRASDSRAVAAVVNLVTLTTSPHLLFMALRDRGPPAVLGLDAPDQDASQDLSDRWAILVGDQTNTPMAPEVA